MLPALEGAPGGAGDTDRFHELIQSSRKTPTTPLSTFDPDPTYYVPFVPQPDLPPSPFGYHPPTAAGLDAIVRRLARPRRAALLVAAVSVALAVNGVRVAAQRYAFQVGRAERKYLDVA